MCFTELNDEDDSFFIKESFIHENRNKYNAIKKLVKTIDIKNHQNHNVEVFFEELFSVHNISNVFNKLTLKNHVIRVIDNKFITNKKIYLLLKEYIRIYEDFVFNELL